MTKHAHIFFKNGMYLKFLNFNIFYISSGFSKIQLRKGQRFQKKKTKNGDEKSGGNRGKIEEIRFDTRRKIGEWFSK